MSCIFSDSDFHLAAFLTTIETSAQDLNVSWQSRLFYLGRYIAFNMIEEDVTKELSLLLLAVSIFIIVNLVFFLIYPQRLLHDSSVRSLVKLTESLCNWLTRRVTDSGYFIIINHPHHHHHPHMLKLNLVDHWWKN